MNADFEITGEKIIALGDTRPRHPLEFLLENTRRMPFKVCEAAAMEKPAAVFHLGDMVTVGAFKSSWRRTFDRHTGPLREAGIPIYPVLGNHEVKPIRSWGLKNYFSQFPWIQGKRWYSVRWGSLLVLVLDSNFFALKRVQREEQDAWLDRRLEEIREDSSIRTAAAFFHHPPYTNVSMRYLVGPDKEVKRRWAPRFSECAKLKLAVSGHIHNYENLTEGGVRYLVSGGGGSPRFALGDRGTVRDFHYLRFISQSEKIKVEMAGYDGCQWSVQDSFVLE